MLNLPEWQPTDVILCMHPIKTRRCFNTLFSLTCLCLNLKQCILYRIPHRYRLYRLEHITRRARYWCTATLPILGQFSNMADTAYKTKPKSIKSIISCFNGTIQISLWFRKVNFNKFLQFQCSLTLALLITFCTHGQERAHCSSKQPIGL